MRTTIVQNYWLAVALASVSLLASPRAIAVADDRCGSADRLIVALRFAQALYPELKGREASISFSHGTGPFVDSPTAADDLRIRFEPPERYLPEEATERSDSAIVSGGPNGGVSLPLILGFEFIKADTLGKRRELACRPQRFTSDASHEYIERARGAIDAHPEWSDLEELKEARKLGLRYGPERKSAILQRIPLRRLAMFYGPLKIERARFSVNAGRKCAGCSFFSPTWEVTVSTSRKTSKLLITIEPFFGNITSIGK